MNNFRKKVRKEGAQPTTTIVIVYKWAKASRPNITLTIRIGPAMNVFRNCKSITKRVLKLLLNFVFREKTVKTDLQQTSKNHPQIFAMRKQSPVPRIFTGASACPNRP
jgi:hypothetical protein